MGKTQNPEPVDLVSGPGSVSWAPPLRRRRGRRGSLLRGPTFLGCGGVGGGGGGAGGGVGRRGFLQSLPQARLRSPYLVPFRVLCGRHYC